MVLFSMWIHINSGTLPKIKTYGIVVLSKLKNVRSLGPDGILAEMLKKGNEENYASITLHNGETPEDCKESLTILIFKKRRQRGKKL